MNALLIVAHGSRRPQSNDEVHAIAAKLKKHNSDQFDIVHAAFLELADPLIPDGIKKCIEEGAQSITVLPYFLNSGRHVVEDIPGIVKDTMKLYPDHDIRIAPHLGASNLMMDLLLACAQKIER